MKITWKKIDDWKENLPLWLSMSGTRLPSRLTQEWEELIKLAYLGYMEATKNKCSCVIPCRSECPMPRPVGCYFVQDNEEYSLGLKAAAKAHPYAAGEVVVPPTGATDIPSFSAGLAAGIEAKNKAIEKLIKELDHVREKDPGST